MGTAWIIASGKGGVGKSTLSACLGMEIARNGQRVCIVDADIGLRDQDVLLGVQDCIVYDILDVANGICPVDDALVVPKPDALPNLSLLPASQFARAKELEAKAFRKILRTLKSNFDHVLIDAPAGIERSLRGLLSNEINECVLVCTPDDVCIRNAERTASVLRKKGLTLTEMASVIAAPFWSTIEHMEPQEAERLTYLRKVFPSLLLTGPFSIILGFSGGLMALNDRLKMRSMVVGEKDDRVFISSEEAAILVMEPDAENIWAPMGGEPVIVRLKEGTY